MKDAVGNDLHIGDRVVMTDSHYKELLHGKVVGFTPKMIRVEVVSERRAYVGQGQNGNIVLKGSEQVCLVITSETLRRETDDAYNRGIDAEREAQATCG